MESSSSSSSPCSGGVALSWPHWPPLLSTDDLLQQLSGICAALLRPAPLPSSSAPITPVYGTPLSRNPATGTIAMPAYGTPSLSNPATGTIAARRNRAGPRISTLSIAYLLLGISSTLMLFGSFAFMLGFMLMPLFFITVFAFCLFTLLGNLKAPGLALYSLIGSVTRAKQGFLDADAKPLKQVVFN